MTIRKGKIAPSIDKMKPSKINCQGRIQVLLIQPASHKMTRLRLKIWRFFNIAQTLDGF